MNRKDQKNNTRQIFFDTAVSLFIQDPHKLTARNIAKETHRSTQPIYSYYKSISRLHQLVAQHTVNELTNLSYTYEFKSSIDLAIWYLNQCPSLTTDILDNNIDLLEHLTSSINQASSDSITKGHLIMLAETQYLYWALNKHDSTVALTLTISNLCQNLKHSVSSNETFL